MNNNLIKKYFDYEYYHEKYPDIKQHCKTYEECIWHFCGKNLDGDGIKEERLFNKKLEELITYGYDKYTQENNLQISEKYDVFMYFLENYEQFKFKKYFDYEYYRKKYPDIKENCKTYEDCIWHLCGKNLDGDGIKEGRLFNKKLVELEKYPTEKYVIDNPNLKNKKMIEIQLYFLDNYDNWKLKYVNKDIFRKICKKLTPLINTIQLPNIKQNLINETLFIEFRILDNIEFLVKKMIITLPCWSHTIICGNINYNYIINLFKNTNVKIIKLDINNNNQNNYNNLLLSKNFWNNFYGEKLLLYQEDSCIFNNNYIENFLKYDYIGAPWPKEQKDNIKNVGNGGFSLRSKSKMLKVLNEVDFNKLNLSDNTVKYIKNSKLDNIPEDVFFSKSLIDFKLGQVADSITANKFSSELIYNKDSLGGHSWFLYNNFKNIDINVYLYLKLLKFTVIYSPYEYSIGGGEKYLSYIIKHFIKKKYFILFINNTEDELFYKTLKHYIDNDKLKYILKYNFNFNILNIKNYCDYFIYMNNSAYPEFNGIGKYNIYHCQFPVNLIIDKSNNTINSYDKIIVNSEFTKDSLKLFYNNDILNNIKIIYPPCNIVKNLSVDKKENTFVMIGRIFKYNEFANNKYFDLAINIFNKFNNYNLTILGSIKDDDYYKTLINKCSINIKIIANPLSSTIIEHLKISKFFINFTGFLDKHKFNEEHFGISYIESLNYGCFPISINKGYPAQHIKYTKYGKIITNENEFENFLREDLNKIQNKIINLDEFNKDKFNII